MTTKSAAVYPPPLGEPPAIQFVAVDRLTTDPSYQRSIDNTASRKLIERIAHSWDWRLCVPLLVAARPEGLFVIDGQHRTEAARMRGDILHLPCSVVAFADTAEEARVFTTSNTDRKGMTKFDLYRARVGAGDAEALVIDRLVREAGLSIANTMANKSMKPGQIGFTTGLFQALRGHSPQIVSAALTTMSLCFAGQVIRNGAPLFGALVSIFAEPPVGFDPDLLQEALAANTPEEWGRHPMLSGVIERKGRIAAMRAAILDLVAMMEAEQ